MEKLEKEQREALTRFAIEEVDKKEAQLSQLRATHAAEVSHLQHSLQYTSADKELLRNRLKDTEAKVAVETAVMESQLSRLAERQLLEKTFEQDVLRDRMPNPLHIPPSPYQMPYSTSPYNPPSITTPPNPSPVIYPPPPIPVQLTSPYPPQVVQSSESLSDKLEKQRQKFDREKQEWETKNQDLLRLRAEMEKRRNMETFSNTFSPSRISKGL